MKSQPSDVSSGLGITGLMDGPAALAAALLTAAVPINGALVSAVSGDGAVQQPPCHAELLDALSLTVRAFAGGSGLRRKPHSK
jgi:hypothetical protein